MSGKKKFIEKYEDFVDLMKVVAIILYFGLAFALAITVIVHVFSEKEMTCNYYIESPDSNPRICRLIKYGSDECVHVNGGGVELIKLRKKLEDTCRR